MAIVTAKSTTQSLRAAVSAIAMVFLACTDAPAASLEELAQRAGIRVLAESTSDKDILAYTKQRMPWSHMSPAAKRRASEVLNDLSQFRRMPSLQYEVNPDIYQYFINHPDAAISTWRVMGISQLEMKQVGDFQYTAAAGDGSTGKADILWRDGNQCLFIVEGTYVSPLLPNPIEASALVWLQYRFVRSNDGRTLVNQQIESFIHFPSAAIDTLARLASKVTNSILDRNCYEVSLYAQMMSKASREEPEWIEQVASRMDDVPPERGLELVQITRGLPLTGNPATPSKAGLPGQRADVKPPAQAFRNFETSLLEMNDGQQKSKPASAGTSGSLTTTAQTRPVPAVQDSTSVVENSLNTSDDSLTQSSLALSMPFSLFASFTGAFERLKALPASGELPAQTAAATSDAEMFTTASAVTQVRTAMKPASLSRTVESSASGDQKNDLPIIKSLEKVSDASSEKSPDSRSATKTDDLGFLPPIEINSAE